MTLSELQSISEAIANRAEEKLGERRRMLEYVAGCHARDVKESLHMSKGARCFAAERIAAASYSARLAWRVAIALDGATC